jgi:hypothetical protein
VALGAVATLAASLAVTASPAGATRPLDLGLFDTQYLSADPAAASRLFDETVRARATIAKIPLSWRGITDGRPANAADPSDPVYRWSAIDRAVRDAAARSLQPLLLVTAAPDFAEGPARPGDASPGTWKPNPHDYAEFAVAVATRYSGSYAGPGGVLPRVAYYQAWNEPNLPGHLAPQWEDGQMVAPALYRELLNAFYGAVTSVRSDNVVLTAGTAPYGDPQGSGRIGPLAFWRDVLCLDRALRPASCPLRASFDILAHHPINTTGPPRQQPPQDDDVSTANLGALTDVLRAAERAGTIASPGPHPLWATELWWETAPPDPYQGIAPRLQARWLAQSMYLLWRQGASAVIYLSAGDGEYHPDLFLEVSGAGLFYLDGSAKPALRAFRFPFVIDRRALELVAWGRAPAAGRVRIFRAHDGRAERVKSIRVGSGEVFQASLPSGEGHRFWARVGGRRSLVWNRDRHKQP